MTTTPAGPAPHPVPSGTMSATPQATVTVPAPPPAGKASFEPLRVAAAEPDPLPGHHPYGRLTPRAVRRLRLHLAAVGLLAAVLVTGWVLGPVRWFWPAVPVSCMLVTVDMHRRRAERGPRPRGAHE